MENIIVFKVEAHPAGHVPGADDIEWGYWVAWDTDLEVVIAQDDTKRNVLRRLEQLGVQP